MGAVAEASRRRGVAAELQTLNHKQGGSSQFGCLDTKFQLKLT